MLLEIGPQFKTRELVCDQMHPKAFQQQVSEPPHHGNSLMVTPFHDFGGDNDETDKGT